MSSLVPVIADGFLPRGPVRFHGTVAAGMTVEQIVRSALPGIHRDEMCNVRVMLALAGQRAVIGQDRWHVVRPNAGVSVLISVIPGKDALRVVLQILVAFAAAATANFIVGTAFFTSAFGTGTFAGIVKSGLGLALPSVGQLHQGYPR